MSLFSVVILTLNEEKNLSTCLQSAAASNDIVVLDSGSTDRTAEIAAQFGARVFVNGFVNFAQQRNFAHTEIPFRHPWVFHLDADEQLTPELVAELNGIAAADPGDLDGFWVAPRMVYRGRWIPHCTDFPAYQARYARVDRFRFIQVGHGQREAPGLRLSKVSSNYLHNLSADGHEALLSKHRRYARQEAAAHVAKGTETRVAMGGLLSKDRLERRRTLKALSQVLPARGVLRFFYQYVLRRGFLDGRPGLAYCVLMARYEHWISREIRSLRKAAREARPSA